jgi:hypothetical protein
VEIKAFLLSHIASSQKGERIFMPGIAGGHMQPYTQGPPRSSALRNRRDGAR